MRVAELSLEELRNVIGDVVDEKLREFFLDPDIGMEMRADVEERLLASLSSNERTSLAEVKRRIGVE
jgi:hypothetical protein